MRLLVALLPSLAPAAPSDIVVNALPRGAATLQAETTTGGVHTLAQLTLDGRGHATLTVLGKSNADLVVAYRGAAHLDDDELLLLLHSDGKPAAEGYLTCGVAPVALAGGGDVGALVCDGNIGRLVLGRGAGFRSIDGDR